MGSIAIKLREEAADALPSFSVEKYLAVEDTAVEKHEYAGGVVIAMAGASETHELISMNLTLLLGNHLRGQPCRVFKSDLKLRVRLLENTYFYYPDVMIACDPEDNENPCFKDRPLVLMEVTSPGSLERDTETKVFAYMSIPSLRSYLIVSHDQRQVHHYHRNDHGWAVTRHPEAGDLIQLPELGLDLTLDDIYERVVIG